MDHQTELLKYLATLGFEGPALTADITAFLEQPSSKGTVYHVINHDKEQMRFALNFEYDKQFNAFRLQSYKATYRKPVDIASKVYNGIDIASLEQEMKLVDWKSWFTLREQSPDSLRAASVHKALDQIASSNDIEGLELRELLRYKYFPPETLDDRSLRNMASEYERERSFRSSDGGFINAQLAYHILNGDFKRLHSVLVGSGLDKFPSIDISSELAFHLSRPLAEFQFDGARITTEGMISFNIPFQIVNGKYEPGVNIVTFEFEEPIIHQKIAHIDTRALEQQMAAIDWEGPGLYELEEDNIRISAHVEQIDSMLNFLDQTKSGKKIAEQLRRKYWSTAPYFEALVPETNDNIKATAEFPLSFPAMKIYNLFCGRAVSAGSFGQLQGNNNEWLRMTGINGTTPQLTTIKDGLSQADLIHLTATLCIQEPQIEVVGALQQGDRIKVNARTLDGYRGLLLEAVPEKRDLKVLNENGIAIPINFRLQTESELKNAAEKKITTGRHWRHDPKHKRSL